MKKEDKPWLYFCIIYGMVSALALIYPFIYKVNNGWIPSFRSDYITANYISLVSGSPFDFTKQTHTLGYVLYFPHLMKLLGITDGHRMFCLVQSAAGFLVMGCYPGIMYYITKSKLCAVITPFVFHFGVGDLVYINKASEYWSGLWILLLAVPILYVLYKRAWDPVNTIWWCVLCLVCSLGNSLRGSAAAPVMFLSVLLLLVMFIKKRVSGKKALLLLLIMACSGNLLGLTIPRQVAKAQGYDGYSKYITSPWHSILIGYGYDGNNKYGLSYDDDSARDFILSDHPEVTYLSDEYFDLCRDAALDILFHDPGFVLKGYLHKLMICIRLIWDYLIGRSISFYSGYIWMMLAAALMGLYLRRKKQAGEVIKKYGVFYFTAFAAMVLSMYSGVLAYPSEYYIWGSLGGAVYLVTIIFLTFFAECCRYIYGTQASG